MCMDIVSLPQPARSRGLPCQRLSRGKGAPAPSGIIGKGCRDTAPEQPGVCPATAVHRWLLVPVALWDESWRSWSPPQHSGFGLVFGCLSWPGSPGTGGSLLLAPAAPAQVSGGAEAAGQHREPAQSRGEPRRGHRTSHAWGSPELWLPTAPIWQRAVVDIHVGGGAWFTWMFLRSNWLKYLIFPPTLLSEIDLKTTRKITGIWKMLFLIMVQVCENSLSLQQHWPPSRLGTHTWLFGCQI